jgi:hypothetical protein
MQTQIEALTLNIKKLETAKAVTTAIACEGCEGDHANWSCMDEGEEMEQANFLNSKN